MSSDNDRALNRQSRGLGVGVDSRINSAMPQVRHKFPPNFRPNGNHRLLPHIGPGEEWSRSRTGASAVGTAQSVQWVKPISG
jgi:hypothetical protein